MFMNKNTKDTQGKHKKKGLNRRHNMYNDEQRKWKTHRQVNKTQGKLMRVSKKRREKNKNRKCKLRQDTRGENRQNKTGNAEQNPEP